MMIVKLDSVLDLIYREEQFDTVWWLWNYDSVLDLIYREEQFDTVWWLWNYDSVLDLIYREEQFDTVWWLWNYDSETWFTEKNSSILYDDCETMIQC